MYLRLFVCTLFCRQLKACSLRCIEFSRGKIEFCEQKGLIQQAFFCTLFCRELKACSLRCIEFSRKKIEFWEQEYQFFSLREFFLEFLGNKNLHQVEFWGAKSKNMDINLKIISISGYHGSVVIRRSTKSQSTIMVIHNTYTLSRIQYFFVTEDILKSSSQSSLPLKKQLPFCNVSKILRFDPFDLILYTHCKLHLRKKRCEEFILLYYIERLAVFTNSREYK